MLRYSVQVTDFYASGALGPARREVRTVKGVTLSKAWRISTRAARRGVKLYGGTVQRYNWGASGGPPGFRSPYRSAAITLA